MGDMVCVVQVLVVAHDNDYHPISFGGGFNFMKEGDIEGVWHMMESGLK